MEEAQAELKSDDWKKATVNSSWAARAVAKLRRQLGHLNNDKLVRALRDPKIDEAVIKEGINYRCETSESHKLKPLEKHVVCPRHLSSTNAVRQHECILHIGAEDLPALVDCHDIDQHATHSRQSGVVRLQLLLQDVLVLEGLYDDTGVVFFPSGVVFHRCGKRVGTTSPAPVSCSSTALHALLSIHTMSALSLVSSHMAFSSFVSRRSPNSSAKNSSSSVSLAPRPRLDRFAHPSFDAVLEVHQPLEPPHATAS